eukprot:TRINITY_DN6354_c0_g1_i1.p1 TRINITY_DN6354_c0_g1~~TRINITY_DN6354_c0_g1_i1.p1  ORF type:complete len:334 (+),score=80.37 TRINITY_DN6354_c0_g1_i1:186-1187(+)
MDEVLRSLEHFDIPRDDEYLYTQSFTVDELEDAEGEARAFFDSFGVVVVRDVLSREECNATMSDIYGVLEAEVEGFDRKDVSTWERWNARSYGMPRSSVVFTRQMMRNRMNPNIYRAYSTLVGDTDLRVNHDRFVLYRPTANGREHWKTSCNLHLDCDPWGMARNDERMWQKVDALRYGEDQDFIVENNHVVPSRGPFVQGILNLLDNEEQDGGFWMIPGFHRVFEQWVEALGEPRDHGCRYILPSTCALMKRGRRVMARAGSLIIWDQRCMHGACPNSSERCRAMMPVRMFRGGHMPPKRAKARRDNLRRHLQQLRMEEEVTDVGKVVFGLQ